MRDPLAMLATLANRRPPALTPPPPPEPRIAKVVDPKKMFK